MKNINYELVKEFILKGDPLRYDFKYEYIEQSRKKRYPLDEEDNPIKRFLIYKWMAKKSSEIDCDKTDLTMSIMSILLESKGLEVEGYKGRYIYLKNNAVSCVETDTINSCWSIYKKMLISTIPDWKGLCKSVGIYSGSGLLSEKNLKIMIDKYDQFNVKLEAGLTEFASLTHSIGNFCVGPVGFNTKKGQKKDDRIDLYLKEIFDRNPKVYDTEAEKWFNKENIEATFLDTYIYNWEDNKDSSLSLREYICVSLGEKLEDRPVIVNDLIVNRGEKMINAIKEHLEYKSI